MAESHHLEKSENLCQSVSLSVYSVDCGKMADRIRMLFGVVCGIGPGITQLVGFGDRFTERSDFGQIWGTPLKPMVDFPLLEIPNAPLLCRVEESAGESTRPAGASQ